MGYSTIVCGVTGSEPSHRAMREAALLAKGNQAGLIYVYGVDIAFLKGMTVEIRPEYAEKTLAHLGGHILEEAEGVAKAEGVSARTLVRTGQLLQVLKDVALEEKADLLVLGKEKPSFFEKLLFRAKIEDHVRELKEQTGIEVMLVK